MSIASPSGGEAMLSENQRVYLDVLRRFRRYRLQLKELEELLASGDEGKRTVRREMLFEIYEQQFSSLIELVVLITTPIRRRVTQNDRIKNEDFEQRSLSISTSLETLATVAFNIPKSAEELAVGMRQFVEEMEKLLLSLKDLRRQHSLAIKSDSYLRIRLCSDHFLEREPSHYLAALFSPLFSKLRKV